MSTCAAEAIYTCPINVPIENRSVAQVSQPRITAIAFQQDISRMHISVQNLGLVMQSACVSFHSHEHLD